MVASLAIGCGSNSKSDDTKSETKTEEKADTKEETKDVESVEQRTVYVTPEWLKSAQDGNQEGYEDVVVAEVAYGDNAKDCDSYQKGHIPGAIYVGDVEVEDATGSEEGAYNLLSASEIEKNLLSHGITKDTKVVLYGGDISGTARVAYAYIWAGVEDVKIVNGGIDAWKKAGYETEKKTNEGTEAKDFGTTVPAHPEYWTSIEDAKDKVANDDNFKLVSIRSEDEWLGKTSGYNYMDKAGEPDNHLAFYCGTGWRATVPFLVLYENGYDNISVYDGGWYEWLMHDDYPVQVGDPASDDCVHTTVGELPTGKAAK